MTLLLVVAAARTLSLVAVTFPVFGLITFFTVNAVITLDRFLLESVADITTECLPFPREAVLYPRLIVPAFVETSFFK